MKLFKTLCVLTASATFALPALAAQEGNSSRPVRVIVPMAPGGGIDTLARLMAPRLSERLGQQVIVENMPGASGIIATDHVAKSATDGHTMILTSNNITINPYLFKTLPFDVTKDLAPVARTTTMPLLVLTHPSVPAKSIPELIAHAKSSPQKLSYASAGTGTPHHLGMELLKLRAGIDLVHVPYKGTPPGMIDVIGGHVPVLVSVATPVADPVRNGRLRAIGTMEKTRLPGFDDAAPVADVLPDFEVEVWHGVYVAGGTPEPVIQRLSKAVLDVIADPGLASQLSAAGIVPKPGSAQELAELTRNDLAKWKDVVASAGIKGE